MGGHEWIYQLSAGSALIVAFLFLLRFLLNRVSAALDALQQAVEEICKAMVNRDQIILNHLDHFQEVQLEIVRLLEKLCKEWEINGGSNKP